MAVSYQSKDSTSKGSAHHDERRKYMNSAQGIHLHHANPAINSGKKGSAVNTKNNQGSQSEM